MTVSSVTSYTFTCDRCKVTETQVSARMPEDWLYYKDFKGYQYHLCGKCIKEAITFKFAFLLHEVKS